MSKLPAERRPARSRPRTWKADLVAGVAAVGVLLAARSSLADHYHVPSGSMQPTVEIGDRVVVSKSAYGLRVPFTDVQIKRFEDPQRGDVVVLASPDDGVTLLKRVVAVPGDQVRVRSGRLILNGSMIPVVGLDEGLSELLDETDPHPLRLERGGGPDFGPVELGEDDYLVMGDNRGNSRDGRMFGMVRRSAIHGRAFAIYLRDGRLTWKGL